MQLGKRKGAQALYTGTIDCLSKTFKAEGMRGIQSGLGPSVVKEGTKACVVARWFVDKVALCMLKMTATVSGSQQRLAVLRYQDHPAINILMFLSKQH
jgi:hypothetical protein